MRATHTQTDRQTTLRHHECSNSPCLLTDVVGETAAGLVELALRREPETLDAVHAVNDREWTVLVLQYQPLGLSLVAARLVEPLQTFTTQALPAVANGPARRAASRTSSDTRTLGVINWSTSSVNEFAYLSDISSTFCPKHYSTNFITQETPFRIFKAG